jgi:hypothetical protein
VKVVAAAARRRERDEGVALGEGEEAEGRRGQQRQDVVHQPLRHERRRRRRGAGGELLLLLLVMMMMWAGRRLACDVPQHHGAARRGGGELRCRVGRLVEGRRSGGEAERGAAKRIGTLLKEVVQYLLLLGVSTTTQGLFHGRPIRMRPGGG